MTHRALHSVAVRIELERHAIYFSRNLVTNLQYTAFLNDAEVRPDGLADYVKLDEHFRISWSPARERFEPDEDFSLHPVTHVTLLGARAYCNWVGGRLPTVEEWEWVAGNGRGDEFPWGDEAPRPDLANFGEFVGGTTPVGSFPPNRFDIHDLAGNVWEWMADEADAPVHSARRHWLPERQYHIKGGGWSYGAESLRIRSISSSWGQTGGNCLGFRPVFDALPWLFETGLVIGRFSPLHSGHVRIVERALAECKHVHVVIGAANTAIVERTFLLAEERKALLASVFIGRLAGIYYAPDLSDDDRWLDSVLAQLPKRPEAVYGGEWRDVSLFERTGLFVCRIIPRRISDGVSGTALRAKLRQGDSVAGSVPEGQAERISEIYRVRQPLFEPVLDDEVSQGWFSRLTEALHSVAGSLYRQTWRFSDPRCDSAAVQLVTNDLATIQACDQVLCNCCQHLNSEGEFSIYAYRTREIPRVRDREGWEEIQLHDGYLGFRLRRQDGIDLLSPWDQRRLYVWNRERRILVAFLHSGDPEAVLDPMRIVREALLETLPSHWTKAHAACVSTGSGGALLTGRKRSGKSTVLMHLLTSRRGFRFVADDKVMLDPERRLVLGVPQAVRFGVRTALGNSILAERILDLSRGDDPGYVLDRRPREEKIQIFPKDLLGLLKVAVKPVSTTDLGVVLDLSAEPRPFEIEEAPEPGLVERSLFDFSDQIRPKWLQVRDRRQESASPAIHWVVCRGSLRERSHLEAIADLVEESCSEPESQNST